LSLKKSIKELQYILPESVPTALGNSLFGVIAKRGNKVIGCGRIIGDGAMFCYLQDIIVMPEHQNQGVGTAIVDALMGWIESTLPEKIYIGLFTGKELHSFYARYSFQGPEDFLYGMCTKKRTGHHSILR
jgi:GNAT superfamily N-acetyltransferase